GPGGGPLAPGTAASAALLKKLNDIVFPEIKFREAAISDVVAYLHDESVKLDPQHEGVNIVLGSGVTGGEGPTVTPTTTEGAAPPTPVPATVGGARPVTLSLRNVPMVE